MSYFTNSDLHHRVEHMWDQRPKHVVKDLIFEISQVGGSRFVDPLGITLVRRGHTQITTDWLCRFSKFLKLGGRGNEPIIFIRP